MPEHRHIGEPERAAILQSLAAKGFCVVEDFAGGALLADLNTEFAQCIERGGPGIRQGSRPRRPAATIRVDRASPALLPAILGTFASRDLGQIAREYVAAATTINDRIKATWDRRPGKITDVHFDSRRALKFFLYLCDTTESNGALRYAAGSHRANTAIRARHLRRGGRLMDVPNVALPNEDLTFDTLEGGRGTLLVFDTDGFHAPTLLTSGEERKVLRARTLFPGQSRSPKPPTWQWLRTTRLNPYSWWGEELPEARRPRTQGTARARPRARESHPAQRASETDRPPGN
ncbi:MAG: phytanoyl-CoA dioxygenase family protein [Deltaproteobacteria bacterium]|nr:phytanoyl-CoA dioxygenase family protein [Deltaproteobacteria bacterium]MBW2444499.1 phytanoyl-CoA dioxygenase family protein [Deltaproteobacteria bacterium]